MLNSSGFDSELALDALNEENLSQIEAYIQSHDKDIFIDLSCCHAVTYRMQEKFQFVPGHRALILKIPEKMHSTSSSVTLSMIYKQLIDRTSSLPMMTSLQKEFLRTIVINEDK